MLELDTPPITVSFTVDQPAVDAGSAKSTRVTPAGTVVGAGAGVVEVVLELVVDVSTAPPEASDPDEQPAPSTSPATAIPTTAHWTLRPMLAG